MIPVHNRCELTRACLASLVEQDSHDFTIVVVDDGSTDGTSEMIRTQYPDTVLLQGDGSLWWVGAVNMGIRYVLGVCQPEDYILVLNDDLVVAPTYIRSLTEMAVTHPKTIIGSLETSQDSLEVIKNGGELMNWRTASNHMLNKGRRVDEFPTQHVERVDRLTGRGTLFPSQVFREAGLYDDKHFKQCGDVELPVRAQFKYGYRLIIAYDAVVVSAVAPKDDINNRQYYTIGNTLEYLFGIKSHYNLRDRFWLAYDVAPNALWFIRFLPLNLLRTVGHFVVRLRLRDPIQHESSHGSGR